MKILSVDTASHSCSVAVVDDETVLAELTLNQGKTHAQVLLEMIQRTLEISGTSISDMDGFATTIGPGSFTGLRIGISTVKGLAVATGKPVVCVSTLAALANAFSFSNKLICPMMDARKSEVYTARYRFDGMRMTTVQKPNATSPVLAVENINEPCIIAGDGALKYRDVFLDKIGPLITFANPWQNFVMASIVANLAMPRFKNNDTDDMGSLVPFYIRKSEAEKKYQKKRESKLD